ncbi:hypothetical protein QBC47DRAFT_27339 [Echria macrotheca]|uniref:Uncharacterized protein n=1 Tax=Echria macrotheca TaxID=438768 RepID=A0AAJ0BN55_9PEZI|nr:hypothetical protein QBC47DRAFT_27339 [Echria macrotheca]
MDHLGTFCGFCLGILVTGDFFFSCPTSSTDRYLPSLDCPWMVVHGLGVLYREVAEGVICKFVFLFFFFLFFWLLLVVEYARGCGCLWVGSGHTRPEASTGDGGRSEWCLSRAQSSQLIPLRLKKVWFATFLYWYVGTLVQYIGTLPGMGWDGWMG